MRFLEWFRLRQKSSYVMRRIEEVTSRKSNSLEEVGRRVNEAHYLQMGKFIQIDVSRSEELIVQSNETFGACATVSGLYGSANRSRAVYCVGYCADTNDGVYQHHAWIKQDNVYFDITPQAHSDIRNRKYILLCELSHSDMVNFGGPRKPGQGFIPPLANDGGELYSPPFDDYADE